MAQTELIQSIERAAAVLGITVDPEHHADAITQVLESFQTYHCQYSVYLDWITARPDALIERAGVKTAKSLGLDPKDTWSSMIIWQTHGNGLMNRNWDPNTKERTHNRIPHTISLVVSKLHTSNKSDGSWELTESQIGQVEQEDVVFKPLDSPLPRNWQI